MSSPYINKVTNEKDNQYEVLLIIPFSYIVKHRHYKLRIFWWMMRLAFKCLGKEKT